MDMQAAKCVNGLREVTFVWADADGDKQKDCDPTHPDSIITELPAKRQEPCHHCTAGQSKDEHGNCSDCTLGKYQPDDLDDVGAAVECLSCDRGSFAMKIFDQKEFEKLPDWLDRQKCNPITPKTSNSSCLFH